MKFKFRNSPEYFVKPFWCLSLALHWHDGITKFLQVEAMIVRRRLTFDLIFRD